MLYVCCFFVIQLADGCVVVMAVLSNVRRRSEGRHKSAYTVNQASLEWYYADIAYSYEEASTIIFGRRMEMLAKLTTACVWP